MNPNPPKQKFETAGVDGPGAGRARVARVRAKHNSLPRGHLQFVLGIVYFWREREEMIETPQNS